MFGDELESLSNFQESISVIIKISINNTRLICIYIEHLIINQVVYFTSA